ncbi:MAG: trypsin-like peptidase domain-containing protein [Actinomycetota bacterium]|nr:trypsin-like peptidase domain-containing protein [Actinomycetota bacterium]
MSIPTPPGPPPSGPAPQPPAGPYVYAEARPYALPPLDAAADRPPQPPRRTGLGAGPIIGIVAGAGVLALMSGVVGGAVGYVVARETLPTSTVTTTTVAGAPSLQPGSIADIAARVQPAVVQLNVEAAAGSGTGSGFVISSDGYIVTNNHVAGPAASGGTIVVAFSDGTKLDGTLVGTNAGYDLAVVKVAGTDLPTVPLGSSETLSVGDAVIAVGSPLGLAGTVTTGIVSALDRPVTAGDGGTETAFINAIQTDAAINPGNSGGPLLNGNGEVVGVNSAIATLGTESGQSGSIGLGFSIPIDTVKRVVDEIITTGSSTTPIIGVSLDMTFGGSGARVEEVTSGSGAEAAGIQAGDTITAIDGSPVEDATGLIVAIRSNAPGDSVTVTVERGGQTLDVPVTLGSSSS